MQQEQIKDGNENMVFIGDKEFFRYVDAVKMQFLIKKAKEVVIKARGRFISRAVDVCEVIRKKEFVNNVELKEIKTDSENLMSKEEQEMRVSTMEITLQRNEVLPEK